MSFLHWITATALAAAAPAIAARGDDRPDPADPRAVVPAPHHESVLERYRRGEDDAATPDQRWHAANDEVQGGGHAGHGRASAPQPAAEAAPEPSPAAGHHPHHHQHHHHGTDK
ncbi:MAG TPA: hypothetical protein VEC06_18860 [Paucimonas sp.]|nr:hypothetical protein [Paucimonas sp.]